MFGDCWCVIGDTLLIAGHWSLAIDCWYRLLFIIVFDLEEKFEN